MFSCKFCKTCHNSFWNSFCVYALHLISHLEMVARLRAQKQPFRGFPREICSDNMQQNYRRTLMPKCDFNNFIEIVLQHLYSPVNLLHIFRTPLSKNTPGGLLLITEVRTILVTGIYKASRYYSSNTSY